MEYTFTLRYRLADPDQDPEVLVERLAEAGCDDALLGIGQRGYLALEFTREAETALQAFRSALSDVKAAIPTARLIEAAPDFVGLSDVAEMIGFSRQNLRTLMRTHIDTFPPPVHGGSTQIWHLDEVLDWLKARGRYPVSEATLETARLVRQWNLARETQRLEAVASHRAVREELERDGYLID
jgi:hypothetical protein